MERELIETNHEWVCSPVWMPFYNPGCALTGLTLNEIILHVKKDAGKGFRQARVV